MVRSLKEAIKGNTTFYRKTDILTINVFKQICTFYFEKGKVRFLQREKSLR